MQHTLRRNPSDEKLFETLKQKCSIITLLRAANGFWTSSSVSSGQISITEVPRHKSIQVCVFSTFAYTDQLDREGTPPSHRGRCWPTDRIPSKFQLPRDLLKFDIDPFIEVLGQIKYYLPVGMFAIFYTILSQFTPTTKQHDNNDNVSTMTNENNNYAAKV